MSAIMKAPNTVRASQVLFFLNAAVWLLFAIYTLARLASGATNQSITMWVVGILMIGNVGAMLLAGFWIGKPRRLFYLFAIVVLGLNIILTLTDQFGVFGFLTLVVDLVLLALMIVSRSWYFKKRNEQTAI
jgi:hypothetical protein